MTRKRYKRYPISVRESALEQMRLGVNVSELAEQLGVHRTTLHYWLRQFLKARKSESMKTTPDPMDERDYRIRELELKVAGMEGELGRAELEKRFFEAALRRVEVSLQKKGENGATASSPRSATGRTRKAN